jgi:hypothetical protein
MKKHLSDSQKKVPLSDGDEKFHFQPILSEIDPPKCPEIHPLASLELTETLCGSAIFRQEESHSESHFRIGASKMDWSAQQDLQYQRKIDDNQCPGSLLVTHPESRTQPLPLSFEPRLQFPLLPATHCTTGSAEAQVG